MKKHTLLIALLAFGLVAIPAITHSQQVNSYGAQPATLSVLIGTAAWSNDQFATAGGALTIGAQVILDRDMSFSLRGEYNRINVGAKPRQSLAMSGIWYWYLGSKWNFDVNPGLDIALATPGDMPIFLGIGLERLLFKVNDPSMRIPFYGTIYAAANFTDETSELRIGIRIAKPEK